MLKVTSEAAYVLKAAREGVTTPTAGLRIKRWIILTILGMASK